MDIKREDLNISGAGSTSGGSFNNVRLSGAASVNGDIDCDSISSSGASNINGNVKCSKIKISGACSVSGNVESEDFQASGGSNVGGDINSKKIEITGGSRVQGNVNAEEICLRGGIEVKGNCEADKFYSNGSFKIGGLLNADEIDINLVGGYATAKEIGGDKISVKMGQSGFSVITKFVTEFLNQKDLLTCDTIEGNDINLEYTKAKIVRGNNITIGPECRIDLVEYKGDIQITAGANVGEQRKLL